MSLLGITETGGAGEQDWRDVSISSDDGLRLHARDYGPRGAATTPALCLAGLTRNAKDFHKLARRLAGRRRVLVPDYRGRGRSDRAPDWRTYTPQVELADTLKLLDAVGLPPVAVIGTSRGGIIAMLMALARPKALRAAVLNDIGPVVESQGLLRIRGYIGKAPPPDWAAACAELKRANPGFEGMSEDDWMAFAHRVYRDEDGIPKLDYDPLLADTFLDEETLRAGAVPPLWEPYKALAARPLLILRGANSDLLSALTVARMLQAAPDAEAVTISDRGHAPFLDETGVAEAIETFLARVDEKA